MNTKDDVFTASQERLNALLGSWGAPIAGANGMMEGQMKRLQQFVSDAQKLCGDAYSGQIEAVLKGNDRLVRSFQDLLQSRQPQEVLAAESNILATFLEAASLNTKRWAELTQKLQECSAAMAREAADDLRQNAQEAAAETGSRDPETHAVEQTTKRSARA